MLSYPEPMSLFMDFGASSLDFELRCFTGDVVLRLVVASGLRVLVARRFAEQGIKIPFPQRVVHLAEPAQTPAAEPRAVAALGPLRRDA